MLSRGIIVSIQGYHYKTITELAIEAINAGCIAIRTDKKLYIQEDKKVPIIGLRKINVNDVKLEAFITPTIDEIYLVESWSDFVAIDYRRLNRNLKDVSEYCRNKKYNIIADIAEYEDFQNIKDNGLYYTYIATTLSVFKKLHQPDLEIIERIAKEEKNLIAEGNFTARKDVQAAYDAGAYCICIGSAISNVYKLTKKYTSIPI
jgi:N-acylglucosamine-6-phosphate 2-epimerase